MDLKGRFAAGLAALVLTGPLAAQADRGTFVLDGKTYAFTVLSCDLVNDLASRSTYTLYGRGKTPAGENFEVFVTRTSVDGIVSHGATVRLTNAQGTRMISRAARSHVSDAWVDGVGDPVDGPLVRVEGNRIRVQGRFRDEHNEVLGTGMLEATCRQGS